MATLIPGTTIPYDEDYSASGEGRGTLTQTPGRGPKSLFEKIGERDQLAPHELAIAAAALRIYDQSSKKERVVYAQVAGRTDASTGNIVLPMFTVPASWECAITSVFVDAPLSTSITPSAPVASASCWAFVAAIPPTTGLTAAAVDGLRGSAVTFAPTSAGGPIIPGQWTFNDSNAPIAYGGTQVTYLLHGGNLAALQAITVQVSFRLNLYARVNVDG